MMQKAKRGSARTVKKSICKRPTSSCRLFKGAAQRARGRRVGGLLLQDRLDDASQQKLRKRFNALVERGHWPGVAACIFVDGKPQLLEESGFADIEGKVPMTSKSLVRVYSMTKCIVAAAVLQLVDEGLFGLDDRLCDHIPAFNRKMHVISEGKDLLPDYDNLEVARRPITIRHLLTHTSGISCGPANGIDGPKKRNHRELAWLGIYGDLVAKADRRQFKNLGAWVEEVAKLPLWNHPGEFYGYGYSYDILGHLIELKTGEPLEKRLQKSIFKPLGMIDTRFHLGGNTPSSKPCKRLSVLYRRTKSARWGSNGKEFRLARVDPVRRGKASRWAQHGILPSGGGALTHLEGGLLSTLEDYSSFLLSVLNGGRHPMSKVRILSPSMATVMLADQTALLRPRAPAAASPYENKGLGLCCLGELQRRGAPNFGQWFDGVNGVRLWGGAASTAFKYDPNGGRPILVLLMTQAFPQDDGATISEALEITRQAVREKKL